MRFLVAFTWVIFTCMSCKRQCYNPELLSNETEILISAIARENRLVDGAIGLGAERTEQFDRFEKLKVNTSLEELIVLTNHPNGVVRTYALWAMACKKDTDIFSIVKNHITDDEIIESQFGCVRSREAVGDLMLELVTQEYPDPLTKKLTTAENKILDSLLIYAPNRLRARNRAIANAKPTYKFYFRARTLYVTEHNQEALVAMSKFKRESDVKFILANEDTAASSPNERYFYTYQAMANFPRAEYFPFLKANLHKTASKVAFSNEWSELYRAIAAQKNKAAVSLLNIRFRTTPNARRMFTYQATLDNYDPIYDDILWRIGESDFEISTQGLRFYVKNDPARAYRMVLKRLGLHGERVNKPIVSDNMFVDDINESMLNFVDLNHDEHAR